MRKSAATPSLVARGHCRSRPRTGTLLIAAKLALAVACAALLALPAAAGADASSLYTGPGPRPGPDILYEPLADAPQLQNTGGWDASPILVSGTSSYRDGEFVYQDYLYDDSGATGSPAQNDPRSDGNSFSRSAGTYLYPTNTATYANNAADFVELRVEPRATDTAFRITLNTLLDPAVVATTIAIGGTSGAPEPWPHGANVSAPAELFLTVHGSTAELLEASTGQPAGGSPPSASVDLARRQITVTVPHATWDPTGEVVRLAAGVGLWNTAMNSYRIPSQNPSATQPGGGSGLSNPPAFFNVAFRFECQQEDPVPPGSTPPGCEPMPNVQNPNAISNPSWWREHAQAAALTSGDISQFFANVDFNKLAAQIDDDMPGQPGGVPQTGAMNRILASHFENGQGANYTESCNIAANGCSGWLRGRLQPYAIYIPNQPMPAGGYGLTLLLHSLGANYNQFLGSDNQSQFGERGAGSIAITPTGRGPDGWYYGYAAPDTFEVWADVAARFNLDPEWTAIAGYSMGGYGTYKFSSQFPDLFAKAQPTVGPPGEGVWVPPADPQPGGAASNTNRMLGSVRNIPYLMWNGAQDELVPVASAQAQADEFGSLGYRYEFDLYNPADHFALAINDEYGPAASFLGTTEVNRDPAHVTYVYNPTMDFGAGDFESGHAYWLSDVTLRTPSGSAPLGTVDVRSRGFGEGDPTPSGVVNGSGVLTGGQTPAMPYTSQTQTWGATPSTPVENRLDINATNVSSITINARRARVDCDVELNVTSDGPLDVNIVDCPYPRPGGGTPLRVPLVPAFEQCTSPNATHATPLALPSCTGPAIESDLLKTSSIGQGQNYARLDAILGDPGTPAIDEADLRIRASASDVQKASDGSDYTGKVILKSDVRITDRANGGSGQETGTVQDSELALPIDCIATASATLGSSCNVDTTIDALVPNYIKEGKRAVISAFSFELLDVGADGSIAPTSPPAGLACPPICGSGDEGTFLRQGVFTP